MMWAAYWLGVAGVVGLVVCSVLAARMRRQLRALGREASLLAERVAQLRRVAEDVGSRRSKVD